MLTFISNTDHYKEVLSRVQSVKHNLWIRTANITATLIMKKILIILVVMLGSLESQAQKISHIETTNSWYYIYDDSGKKIKTVSTSTGELKGYRANFYIIQHGTWIYTYDPTGKKLHTFAVSSVGKSSL